ncbi:DNA polymerase III subunit gamma/tau [Fusobacterium massiliense]|jgi:DNA polymerase III, subunit gamma and tau|uniref:DNA polymerase III subunit gamma/tau n=1 Tax=Fusobacterium massiliense TaxID=1852365 RepID=UPI0028D10259|nr:DNA polymerase III subunit gamma/tau [Fusobacterium massiliense]
MHITLYRKYRPTNFSEVSGENEIVKTLKLSLKNNSMAHAYLFSGPRGVGKTTTARLIAKGVNCLNLHGDGEPCNECKNCQAINEGRFADLIEIDAASNRSIEEIRNLKEKINYQPVEGLKKVYIIDEAHMLTKEAFNALLKTLEEPPAHVLFILATTELDKILPTIISRCQRYDFKTLSLEEMKNRLEYILKEEGFSAEEEVFPIIYENATGSMRDSISILERLIVATNGEKIDLKTTEETLGITPSSRIKNFLEKVLVGKECDIIDELEKLSSESFDLELFFKDFAKYCKNSIVKNMLDIDKGLKIISIIYDVLGKFKFEEDKKLVGYVIIADILEKLKPKKEEVKVKYISEPDSKYQIHEEAKIKKSNVKINLSDVKANWKDFLESAVSHAIYYKVYLMGASPYKIEDNILTIIYEDSKWAFIKETMETNEYKEDFTEIIREFFEEPNLNIEFELAKDSRKKDKRNSEEEFLRNVENYLTGRN